MTLHGCDVSHWQAGLNLAKTGLAFAIMKATDGSSYVDAECNTFVSQAKKAGMLYGVYHFWQAGVSATKQADHFVDSVRGYLGEALLVLDWESSDTGNVSGAKAFLDHVYAKTGIRPVIYMSQSVAAGHNWSSVAHDYALWVARYGSSSYGDTGAWAAPLMWQHTSSGHVSGYGGNVDLDYFYGNRDTWAAFATGGKQPAPPSPSPEPTPDGDDDMPSWKNVQYTEDYTLPADGEWHTLRTDTSDDGDTYYSVLPQEAYATGTLHVTLTGLAKGHEVNLRTVLADIKSGEPARVDVQGSVVEAAAISGGTQIVLPFTVHVNASSTPGYVHKLRFQIRAYGGEKITITGTHTRLLYWKR